MTAHGPLGGPEVLRLQRSAGNRAVARLAPAAVWLPPAPGPLPRVRRAVNGRLDAVPRRTVAGQPAFRVAIWSASAVAVAAGTAVAPAAGVRAATFLVAAAVVMAVVVAALLLHRLPSYSLHAVVFAGALIGAALLGADAPALLDAVAVGLAAGQAVGRVGCAMAGCCHGRPCAWGHRYDASHAAVSRWVSGVRVAPVQLLESASCAGLAVTGALIVASGAAAGMAFATLVVGYAAGRFVFEELRGDAGRRYRAGLSDAQWIAAGVATAIVCLSAVGALPLAPLHVALAGAVAVAVWAVARDGTARALRRLDAAGLAEAPGGLRLSAARAAGAWTYGISRPDRPLAPSEACAVARRVLRLRHADAGGLLLPGPPFVLIATEEEP